MSPAKRFRLALGDPIVLPGVPPKTTLGGARSPEGRRIAAYMDEIGHLIEPWSTEPEQDLGMSLCVGLPEDADLLVHHDLDNFLEPFATHLGSSRVAYARATKAHRDSSMLTLGPATPTTDALEGWHT